MHWLIKDALWNEVVVFMIKQLEDFFTSVPIVSNGTAAKYSLSVLNQALEQQVIRCCSLPQAYVLSRSAASVVHLVSLVQPRKKLGEPLQNLLAVNSRLRNGGWSAVAFLIRNPVLSNLIKVFRQLTYISLLGIGLGWWRCPAMNLAVHLFRQHLIKTLTTADGFYLHPTQVENF